MTQLINSHTFVVVVVVVLLPTGLSIGSLTHFDKRAHITILVVASRGPDFSYPLVKLMA